MEVKVRGRIGGCIGATGFGPFEGRGQDLELGVLRWSWAILRQGWSLESWAGVSHLALVTVLAHVLLVTQTVLTFRASLGTGGVGEAETLTPFGSHLPFSHLSPDSSAQHHLQP